MAANEASPFTNLLKSEVSGNLSPPLLHAPRRALVPGQRVGVGRPPLRSGGRVLGSLGLFVAPGFRGAGLLFALGLAVPGP